MSIFSGYDLFTNGQFLFQRASIIDETLRELVRPKKDPAEAGHSMLGTRRDCAL